MTTTTQTLKPGSEELFKALANDANNWSGSPLVDISKDQRWNLTDLKKKGLLETWTDEGCTWCNFTAAGIELAKTFGIEIYVEKRSSLTGL